MMSATVPTEVNTIARDTILEVNLLFLGTPTLQTFNSLLADP